MMKYLYVNNLAYPYELQSLYVEKGEWPEEKGVDIDEVIFREYFYDTPPEGKYRCVGEDGLPAWADIPPPTREEQIASAETKKQQLNRPGFPGECFICELRLPDHRFRWKHNKLFLLLPEEYGPAFPAIVDCYTSPPT